MSDKHFTQESLSQVKEVDLIQMLLVIWKRKWLILGGTIIVTIIALVITSMLPRVYKSSGFVNAYWPYRDIKEEDVKLKKVDLDDFGFKIEMAESKKIIKLFKDKGLFRRFLEINRERLGLDIDFLNSLDINPDNKIKMVFALEQFKKKQENYKNFVIGYQLQAFGSKPRKVEKMIHVLKEYISRIIINNEIIEYININLNWEKYKLTRNKSRVINCRYDMSKLKERENLLTKLAREFPGLNNTQVIINSGKNKSFYTPLQQLVSTKIEIADMEERIERIRREDVISAMRMDLLERFNKLIVGKPQVLIIYDMLEKAREVFSKYLDSIKEDNNEFLQMVKSEFEDKLAYFDQLDSYVIRLASNPSLPRNSISPKKKTILIFSFFSGLLIFILIAFLVEAYISRKQQT